MRKNLSQPNLTMSGLSVRKINQPMTAKKVQGFDKTSASDTFASKIEKIKKRPQQTTLQDQYVNGLQDEIQYLEMELKLLKEKQIAKHSQVDQLETFFGDGIPINENILAIKNGFNNHRNDCDKRILQLQKQKQQRTGLIEGVKSRSRRLTEEIQNMQKNNKTEIFTVGSITHSKVKEDARLKEEIEQKEQILRNFKIENRRFSQKISTFLRNKEIQSVAYLKNEGNKFNKLNKIRESIANKEKQHQILEIKYADLKKQQQQKSYVIKLEQNNLKAKKKAISLEKELNSLQIKIEQKKFELQEKLKERQKQISSRMEMMERLTNVKESMDRENALTIEELQKHALQNQISELQRIVQKNRKIAKYVSFYSELLSKIEDEIQTMGELKPDLKRQLHAYLIEAKNVEKDLSKAKVKRISLIEQLAQNSSKIEFINHVMPISAERTKKNNEKLKYIQAEREKLYEEIRVREKQIELVEILKSLSLEEVQISSSSNSSIQDRLLDFMRNWDSLSRS